MQETGLRGRVGVGVGFRLGGSVPSLDQEVSLEEEMATHSGILAWEIPRTEEPGRL